MTTVVIETSRIPPPQGGATELSLPLTYFDVTWIHFHPIRRLLFFDHPCSEPEFFNAIVPNLKQSLSLTLKHYLPVAGNLLYPSDTEKNKPIFRYVSSDSVPLTIAVSSRDFDDLIGYHARESDQFYDFIPEMPPVTENSDHKIVPVFALQTTLFPDRGLCIGFSNHHALGDASSMLTFIKTWASMSKLSGGGAKSVENLPILDRCVISDPHGYDALNWEVMREAPFTPSSSFPLPTNRVRATFILKQADIKKLKDMASANNPDLNHVSSFVVTTSYIWSCLAKSGDFVGEVTENEGMDNFIFMVDVRARTDPPVPENYFGNCLSFATVTLEHCRLTAEDGFVAAAEVVSREIRERVNNREEVLRGMQNWRPSYERLREMRALGVSGSPKFDLCGADFGWGKAKKLEVLSIDGEKYSMSLCMSKCCDGGLEVGLSLGKERMEAFAQIFARGLKSSG